MKNFYILISLCLLSNFLSGQSYQPCLNGNKIEWNYISYEDETDIIGTVKFKIQYDTTINNNNYKKVFVKDLFKPYTLRGFIREDTTLKKVWFLEKDSTKEFLYKNFNLSVTDTFIFYRKSGNLKLHLTVTKVEVNDGRKIIEFQQGPKYYFIEGLGSSISLLEYIDNTYDSQLLCVTVDDSLVYKNSLYSSCDTFFGGSVKDLKKNELFIYPNPFDDHITVNSDQIETIRLFSLAGKLEIESNKAEINTSKLTPGLYILELETKSKLNYRKKVIKQ